ncbi:MAG: aquaporin [Proteobacteria bacterium]|nr:aquaporin [Pseudomonadota bacterium]
MRSCVAEFIGTFALVFAGTAAIIVNDVTGGLVTHVGIALTFGLIIMSMIYAVGDISGAHFNPAVTVAFWAARLFPGRQVLPYLASQVGGALAASVILKFLFPGHETLGATIPVGSEGQSFVMEIILTFFLMFVILNVATGAKEKGIMAGSAIGAVVALEALFAGPVSGASMNPARSLAPALVSGHLDSLWIYLAAPVIGAIIAVPGCRCIKEEGCCSDMEKAGCL